ncbi:MAG: hypothetical protein JRJ59_11210 [Deltaproteobacteria bacterium]|nr:hypothetical protein [Deltaproteobacteria bacterium]
MVKKTALFTFPLIFLGGLGILKRRLASRRLFWAIALALGLVLAGGLALAAFFPPAARLFVSLFGLPLVRAWGPGFDPLVFRQPGVIDLIVQELNPLDPVFWLHAKSLILLFFKSFWAYFGYLTAPMAWWWYAGAAVLAGAGLAGWARFGFSRLEPAQGLSLIFLAAGLGLALIVILVRQAVFFPGSLAQGRHLFPAMVPLALLWAAGFKSLWPARLKPLAAAGALAFLWIMDLKALWGVAVPWFYRLHL